MSRCLFWLSINTDNGATKKRLTLASNFDLSYLWIAEITSGEGGIRTLDAVLRLHNTLAVCRFRPTQPPLQKGCLAF